MTTNNTMIDNTTTTTPDTTTTTTPTTAPTTPTPTPTTRTRRSVVVDAGVVGTAPNGYDALFTAARVVNANTDMSVSALRADVKRVTREMIRIAGDRPLPPAGRGRWTGIRTYDGQNNMYALNDRAEYRVTDRTLIVMWATEYPSNKCDFTTHADYIGSTRADYIREKPGHGTNTIDPAHRRSHRWDVNGKRS